MSVDLDEVRRTLGDAGTADRAAWGQIRGLLLERAGESTFEIWLGELRLVAVDAGGALVLDGPYAARSTPSLASTGQVVIDTPPNLGLLTVNALVCADTVIAPVSGEDEASVHGILELRETIRRLAQRLGVSAPTLIALLTRWQPHRISSRRIERGLIAAELAPVTRVRSRSAALARAAERRVPLSSRDPDSSVALSYLRLCERLAEVSVG